LTFPLTGQFLSDEMKKIGRTEHFLAFETTPGTWNVFDLPQTPLRR